MSAHSDTNDGGSTPFNVPPLMGTVVSFRGDATAAIVAAADGFERLTGHDTAWLAADAGRFWQLFDPHDRERLRAFVRSPRTEPENFVAKAVHRDGHPLKIEMLLLPAVTSLDTGGATHGLMVDACRGTGTERAMGRMLGDLAGKLRAPIGALTVASTTLARSDVELSEEQRRTALHILDRSGRRLAALLIGMADLTRLRQAPVVTAPVDLIELVEDVLRRDGMMSGSVGIDVTGSHPIFATVERWSLARAVAELVRNAGQHGGAGVAVRVGSAAGEATVEVVDTGPGVPPEAEHRLFEPFVTGPPDPKGAAGPGLGLAIAAAAVQRSGATLDHRRGHPSGATFTIRLSTSSERQGPVSSPPPIRVIVLAAQRLMGDTLAVGLQQWPRIGRALAVTDMDAVESLMAQLHAEVVVVDLDRFQSDALEEAHRLSASFPSARLLVIGTALTLDDLAGAVELGAHGIVPKELGLAVLADAVVRVLHTTVFVDAATLLALSREEETRTQSDVLTDRELEVLQLLAHGYDAAKIARELRLQVSTCRGYIKSILAKLHAHSQLEAVVAGSRLGLVRIPGPEAARRSTRRPGSGPAAGS